MFSTSSEICCNFSVRLKKYTVNAQYIRDICRSSSVYAKKYPVNILFVWTNMNEIYREPENVWKIWKFLVKKMEVLSTSEVTLQDNDWAVKHRKLWTVCTCMLIYTGWGLCANVVIIFEFISQLIPQPGVAITLRAYHTKTILNNHSWIPHHCMLSYKY